MEHVTGARPWHGAPGRRPRPRLLVESADPAFAVSDFTSFEAAGLDVALCPGPSAGDRCPLLAGEECDLVAQADVVLHCLGPDTDLVAAIRRRRPGMGIVVEHPRPTGASGPSGPSGPSGNPHDSDEPRQHLPGGCVGISTPCSVVGRLDALRRSLPATLR